MKFLLVFALALVQALAGGSTTQRSNGYAQSLGATSVRAVYASVSDAEAVARAPGTLYHALRVARGATSATLDRTTSGNGGGPRVPPAILVASLASAAIASPSAEQGASAERVIASRGSLLAYYPTAPPLAG